MALIFSKGNIYTKIDKKIVTGAEVKSLHEILSVKVPGHYYSKKFRMGQWDGFKHFFNRLTGSFYSGLLGYVTSKLNCEYQIVDDRIPVLSHNNPIHLNGIELRDYQIRMIDDALAHGRGIISSPPNSGKTLVSAAITQILGLPTVFLTHRITLLEQTKKRFEQYLGVEVGIFGAKQRSFRDINIMSIVSVYKALENGDEEIEDILKKASVVIADECIDGEHFVATQYGYRKLKTIKVGDELITPSGRARVKDIWKVEKEAYEVTLRSGKKFIVSEDHLIPSFKKRAWQSCNSRDSELIIDKVSKSSNFLAFKESLRFDDDFDAFAYFLGWFIGDGTLAKNLCRFGFTKDVDIIRTIFQKMGFKFTEVFCKRGDTLFNFGSQMRMRLMEIGFKDGKKSTNCFIPEKYQFNKWTIRGLFEAEGSSNKRAVSLDMCSKKCIDQISRFLFCNGIRNYVRGPYLRKNKNHNSRYRVTIYGEYIEKFHRIVGCSIFRKQKNRQVSLKHKLQNLVQFDSIKSMKKIGIRELYDISLDDDLNLFIVEGYLFHNCHHLAAKTFENTMRICKNAYFRYGLCVSQGSGILLPSGRERKIGALWLAGLKEFDVLSFNHTTNKIEPKKACISRIPWDNDTLIIKIKSEDGFTVRLECSSEHNIYSNGEYKEAKDLEIGDNVLMAEMQKNYCLICGKEIPLYRRLCSKKCLIRNWILEGAKGQSKRLQKMTKEERIEAINWKIGLEKAINWAKSEDGKKHNSEYIKNRFKTDPKFAKAVSDGAKKFWKSINEKGLGLKGCRNRWKKYPTKVERLNHLKEIGCYQGFEKHQFKKGHISPHPPIINGKYYNNKVSLGRDGHKLVSIVEKKVDDWLFDNRLEHKIHPSIRGTGKYADFLVNDWYIEADGLHRGRDYFNKKYEGKKNWIVVDDFSYSSIGEKLSFLLVSDPVGKVVSIRKVKFNGKFLYDLSVEGNNNFFANGVLVHNSATALLRSEVDNMLVMGLTGDEITGITNRELTECGVSAKATVYLFDMNRFGSPILPKRHTFDVAYDIGIVDNPQRNTLIVDTARHFLELGKSVFIIVHRIEHGRILSEIFRRVGLEVPFISGEDDSDIIKSRLKEFESKTLKCLVSSSISDEGIDIPAVDVLILGVGGRSHLKTIQRVGRGLRKKTGENTVNIIDFIDRASPYLYKHSIARCSAYVNMDLKMYEVLDREWREIKES